MNSRTTIKFASSRADFFTTLNQRVNEYFKSKNISRHANAEMIFKTIFMCIAYFVPYFLMMFGIITNPWIMWGLCLTMGVSVAGIGLSVMHDANHGAYSGKKSVNDFLGYTLNMVGGNSFNWRVQHNVLHHTYTNIHDVDEDISPRGVLRFTPHGNWKPFHRFQYLYAWFFYGLMTFVWVAAKDFARLGKYDKEGLIRKQKSTFRKELIILGITKVLYFSYILVIPMIVLSSVTWWQVLIGFISMHYVAGFILAVIFQPAHVVEGSEFPMPDDAGQMENSWAIHQLYTTMNFANNNPILTWYAGGLNFQVEHHLFPGICHVHYPHLSAIVKETAAEYGLPYKAAPTLSKALWMHGKMLYDLGKKPDLQTVATV
jgi:linoleoyl-CoA desaturase